MRGGGGVTRDQRVWEGSEEPGRKKVTNRALSSES